MLFKYEDIKLIINKSKLKDEDKKKIIISMGKNDLIKYNKEIKAASLIYELKYITGAIQLFGNNFINNNYKKIRIIFKNRERNISNNLAKNENIINKIKIKMKIIDTLLDLSDIFYNCKTLAKIGDISEWNTDKVKNMSGLFYNCFSLESLPDISKWKTKNVLNLS